MEFGSLVKEITPGDLKNRLDAGDNIVILDVREPHELAICSLSNTVHIPLGQLPYKISELEPYKNSEIAVYCRSGKRSERAVMLLKESGFSSVVNLTGGILAWAESVDPSMTRY